MTHATQLKKEQWFVLAAAFLGWMFDGFEMGLFPLAGRPALRDLMKTVAESGVVQYPAEAVVGQWYSYLVALFLLGAATGGLIFGWLGDRLGRVRTMALSILVYAGFTGLCYFATAPWHLGALRFCAAVGMGGEWSLGVALVMECWPEKLRPLLAGVIGAAANFGFLLVSLLGALFDVKETSWQWMMIAGAAPGVLAIFVLIFIPESERWKAAVREAVSKPIREIFTTRLIQPTLFGIAFASVALIGTWGAVSAFLPPWTDQLAGGNRHLKLELTVRADAPAPMHLSDVESTQNSVVTEGGLGSSRPDPTRPNSKPKYRIQKTHQLKEDIPPGKTFLCQITISNVGEEEGREVVYRDVLPSKLLDPQHVHPRDRSVDVTFDPATGTLRWRIGTVENKDPRAKGWIQTVLSIGAILGCFLGPLLGHWLSRRIAYFILCTLSLLSSAYLFRVLDEYNYWFVAVTGFVGLVTASFYGWLPLYLPELFPTRVRATGQGVSFNSGRILAAAGALTTGQLMQLFEGSYARACAAISLVYLVGMILIWFAPETKGKPLPE